MKLCFDFIHDRIEQHPLYIVETILSVDLTCCGTIDSCPQKKLS